MTNEISRVQRQLERALAFAHAALEETTIYRVAQAHEYADRVLPQVIELKPMALSEARQVFEHVTQLRAVLRILDQKFRGEEAKTSN
jgi:hypothetical protein